MKIDLENFWLRRSIIALLLIILFFCSCNLKKQEQIFSTDFEENYSNIAPTEITEDIIYSQKTICLSNELEKIGILFANYGNRENIGDVFIKIFNSEQKLIGRTELPASEIGDGVYYYVTLDEKPALGELIEIQVSSSSQAGKAVTIWCNENIFLNRNGAKLIVAGVEQTGLHMNIVQIYKSPELSFTFWIIVLIAFVICVFCGIPQYYYNKWKRDKKITGYYICFLLFVIATAIICLRNMQFITTPIIYAEDGVFLSRQIDEGIFKTLLLNRNGVSIFKNSQEFSNVGTYIILWIATKTTMLLNGYNLSALPFWVGIYSNMFFAFVAVMGYKTFERMQMKKVGFFTYLAVISVNLGTASSEVLGHALNTQFLWVVPTTFLLMMLYHHVKNTTTLEYILYSMFCMIAALSFPVCFAQISGYLVMVIIRAYKNRDLLKAVKRNIIFILTLAFGVFKLPQLLNVQGAGSAYTFKLDSAIEFFVARHLLFPFVGSVYSYLTDAIVIALFAIYLLVIFYAGYIVSRKEGTIFHTYTLLLCLTLGTCFTSAYMRRTMTQFFDNYNGTYPDRYFYGCNLLSIVLILYAIWIIMNNNKVTFKIRDGVLSTILCLLFLNPNLFYFTNQNYSQYLYGENGFQGTFKQSCEAALAESQSVQSYYKVKIYPAGWVIQLPFSFVIATAQSTN